MNAKHALSAPLEHPTAPASEPAAWHADDGDEALLCALLDGELSETALDDWLACDRPTRGVAAQARTHQLIGDVLRGQSPWVAGTSASVFLAGVQHRLLSESAPTATPAAAFTPLPRADAPQQRAPAANDSVFRWKLVAGLASLAAVMAVSWGVLDTTGTRPAAPAAQLALSQPSPADTAAVAAPRVVNTRQGVLIRDAELEALMAEHRQHGGVSALQMPAGFLRNATHDASAR